MRAAQAAMGSVMDDLRAARFGTWRFSRRVFLAGLCVLASGIGVVRSFEREAALVWQHRDDAGDWVKLVFHSLE